MASDLPILKPGSTLGILGGGQLGRMLALAAARFGLHCHVFSPEKDSCAFDVVREKTCASFEDEAALARFANNCDIITFEFENVPAETADFLVTNRKPVLPDPAILATTQDRLAEKHFLTDFEIKTAPYAEINSDVDVSVAIVQVPAPAVMKTRRLGYDGKGQAIVPLDGDPAAAWRTIGEVPAILEGFMHFDLEISVVAARGRDGSFVAFDPVENAHRDHILHQSTVPASITPAVAKEAVAVAKKNRGRAEICRRARGRNVRLPQGQKARIAGERDRAARAQLRSLDDRRRECEASSSSISARSRAGRC